MSEDEDSRDLGGAGEDGEEEEVLSLPRIVVGEDSIVVLEENEWVGRDVEGDEDDVEGAEDLEGLVGDEVSRDGGVNDYEKNSPQIDADFREFEGGGDVYGLGRFEGSYEVGEGLGDDGVGYDVGLGENGERVEDVWGKRSMLEVVGFRDKEAEKRRARQKAFR